MTGHHTKRSRKPTPMGQTFVEPVREASNLYVDEAAAPPYTSHDVTTQLSTGGPIHQQPAQLSTGRLSQDPQQPAELFAGGPSQDPQQSAQLYIGGPSQDHQQPTQLSAGSQQLIIQELQQPAGRSSHPPHASSQQPQQQQHINSACSQQ